MGCEIKRGRVDRAAFPPEQVAEVKAVACEPPARGAPLSRCSTADVHRLVVERGICDASQATILRWLRQDAIRPWQYRSWIFPTDPDFAQKAGRILDLYEGRWEGRLLHPGDCVISADEKPSIQARRRICETLAPAPACPAASASSTPTRRYGSVSSPTGAGESVDAPAHRVARAGYRIDR
jgi:hypothetical protein